MWSLYSPGVVYVSAYSDPVIFATFLTGNITQYEFISVLKPCVWISKAQLTYKINQNAFTGRTKTLEKSHEG